MYRNCPRYLVRYARKSTAVLHPALRTHHAVQDSCRSQAAVRRIVDLCRALEITPNDLLGVSSKVAGDDELLDHENSLEIR
jgi:hypothetical protein